MATKMSECDFSREPSGWCCEGDGYMEGERSFGHGPTKQAAYDDYRHVLREEEADAIELAADEAEMIQSEMNAYGEDRSSDDPIGTSLRDHLAATADVDAMRERARRLRG